MFLKFSFLAENENEEMILTDFSWKEEMSCNWGNSIIEFEVCVKLWLFLRKWNNGAKLGYFEWSVIMVVNSDYFYAERKSSAEKELNDRQVFEKLLCFIQ